MTDPVYTSYVLGPLWARRRARHLRRRPTCAAHGRRCRATTVHHASYWGWRRLGVELPWETVCLCRRAHDEISTWHRGRRVSNRFIFAVTWYVIARSRLLEPAR